MYNIQRLILLTKHRLTLDTKPAIQHSRIDPAKISVDFRRAVFQIRETGALADESALELTAGHEDGGRRTVVRAAPTVLFDLPAEFRERH